MFIISQKLFKKKNTSTWWLHFHQNDRTHNSEMPFYHKTHPCWINYNHKHLNSLLSPQESAKDPKSPLYQELAWESEEEGFSCHGSGKAASSVIYPNAENSSVMCRHEKIQHAAEPGSCSNSHMVWYISAIMKNIFGVFIGITYTNRLNKLVK